MVEVLTEIVAGLVVLACAVLWIPHEVSIRELRKELDDAKEEIQEMRREDYERDQIAG